MYRFFTAPRGCYTTAPSQVLTADTLVVGAHRVADFGHCPYIGVSYVTPVSMFENSKMVIREYENIPCGTELAGGTLRSNRCPSHVESCSIPILCFGDSDSTGPDDAYVFSSLGVEESEDRYFYPGRLGCDAKVIKLASELQDYFSCYCPREFESLDAYMRVPLPVEDGEGMHLLVSTPFTRGDLKIEIASNTIRNECLWTILALFGSVYHFPEIPNANPQDWDLAERALGFYLVLDDLCAQMFVYLLSPYVHSILQREFSDANGELDSDWDIPKEWCARCDTFDFNLHAFSQEGVAAGKYQDLAANRSTTLRGRRIPLKVPKQLGSLLSFASLIPFVQGARPVQQPNNSSWMLSLILPMFFLVFTMGKELIEYYYYRTRRCTKKRDGPLERAFESCKTVFDVEQNMPRSEGKIAYSPSELESKLISLEKERSIYSEAGYISFMKLPDLRKIFAPTGFMTDGDTRVTGAGAVSVTSYLSALDPALRKYMKRNMYLYHGLRIAMYFLNGPRWTEEEHKGRVLRFYWTLVADLIFSVSNERIRQSLLDRLSGLGVPAVEIVPEASSEIGDGWFKDMSWEELPDVLNELRAYAFGTTSKKMSKQGRNLVSLISVLPALCAIPKDCVMGDEISFTNIFTKACSTLEAESLTLERVVDCLIYWTTFGVRLSTTQSLSLTWAAMSEDDTSLFFEARNINEKVIVGNYLEHGETLTDLRVRLLRIKGKLNQSLQLSSGAAKAAIAKQCMSVDDYLLNIDRKEAGGTDRSECFTLTMVGRGGCGKSYAASKVNTYLHKLLDLEDVMKMTVIDPTIPISVLLTLLTLPLWWMMWAIFL
jgi:hypothetical protein